MAKTRIQRHQRPHAKGKHQRKGQRAEVRENPPSGLPWGSQNWPGTGGGVATPYGLLAWEAATVAPPSSMCIRANSGITTSITHLYLSETYQPGSVGDPIATLIVNDPIRLYDASNPVRWGEFKITAVSDAGAYRDYTVTYTGVGGGGIAFAAGQLVGILERTGTPGEDPQTPDVLSGTIDEVKAYVNGLPDDDNRDNVIQALLDRERVGQNRSTLVSWLDQQTGVE